ncbi:hypothetical protein SAMN05421805_11946 [Saccharopolyspora antimicrobica]|uniref:Uncharacterized protein n=1 Tax=Saccharopolyspora antimicrobica TaxID=455193 RepID=A0A1I5IP46_9PSEU|nr:IniB N-terminal domain-containing protein [Saccharopolyspora antimicrobica]RKT84067.1 hypothetical protein ATL45_2366 [Saccharopolyspora antimicrobica]SFO61976.1 hypothetical protein SAMN05421805_11946 [Saccharopolyspora antimicrobica]
MMNPQHATGRAESSTPDPGTHSAGLPEEPTLYEFLTRLVSDPAARSAFDTDPQATLDQAGLGGMSATDVLHASSLVLDYAPVEVVTEYGRSLQSSVEKFAASSQAVAFNQLHPAHPLDQEEQSMLQNTPAQPEDFGKDNDVDATLPAPAPAPSNNTDVDVDIEQNDSHNLISIHHVLSDNSVGNDNIIGSVVGNTVGQVGDSLDLGDVTNTVGNTVTEVNSTATHVFDTSVDLTAGAGSLVYGDVTNVVGNTISGDTLNIVGDLNVGNVLGNVTNGDVTEIVSNAPVVGDVVTNVGDTVTNAPLVGDVVSNVAGGDISSVTGVVGDVTSVAGDLPVVGDVAGVAGGVVGEVPVVGDALGGVTGGDVSILPVDDVTAAVPAAPVETVTDTVGSLPVVGEVADTATSALPLDLDGLL